MVRAGLHRSMWSGALRDLAKGIKADVDMTQFCDLHDMVSDTLVFYEQTKSQNQRSIVMRQFMYTRVACRPAFQALFVQIRWRISLRVLQYVQYCMSCDTLTPKNCSAPTFPSVISQQASVSADRNKAILRLTESDTWSNSSSLPRSLARRLNPALGASEQTTRTSRDCKRYSRLLSNTSKIRK